jgi:GTP-binding protein
VKSLARTSKTPGRTQEINFFDLGNDRRLVDLPGYGYAKVTEAKQRHWADTLGEYLLSRASLAGLILLMDVRHPLKEYDRNMVHWCTEAELPVYVILNKADKLSRGKAGASLLEVKKQLAEFPIEGIQLFSALKRTGVDEALQQLCRWLDLPYNE